MVKGRLQPALYPTAENGGGVSLGFPYETDSWAGAVLFLFAQGVNDTDDKGQ